MGRGVAGKVEMGLLGLQQALCSVAQWKLNGGKLTNHLFFRFSFFSVQLDYVVHCSDCTRTQLVQTVERRVYSYVRASYS